MPKLILEFDTEIERNAAEIAVKSLDYALAWNELREWIRQKIKYHSLSDRDWHTYNTVQHKMVEIGEDRQLLEVE